MTAETPIQKARRLVNEAARACQVLYHSLPDGHECDSAIGAACDELYSADGYLEKAARRLAGDEKMPVPILPAPSTCRVCDGPCVGCALRADKNARESLAKVEASKLCGFERNPGTVWLCRRESGHPGDCELIRGRHG
jgi:hypothetical protein